MNIFGLLFTSKRRKKWKKIIKKNNNNNNDNNIRGIIYRARRQSPRP